MTGMRWRVVDAIRDLDAERWDALAGAEVMMTHRWQRVMEASRVAYRPRYVLAEDNRGPLVAIVADANPSFGRSGWRNLMLRRLTLIVGAPYSSRHCGISMRSDASTHCVDRLLRDLSWSERRPVLGVANVHAADLPAWSARRFHARPQPPSMVLDLPSPSYDHYLARLAGRDRHELRRAQRRACASGVSIREAPLEGSALELYPLLSEVARRHRSVVFSPELFPALARELNGQVVVLSAAIGGQQAGFFLCLRQGDSLLAIMTGLRYALAYPSSLYFVLLDELIRWSLDRGIQRIHAGLSNEVQKQRHGFRPRARWLCVRANPHPFNLLLGQSR
jgi:predicted N-acyltransferase